MTQIRDDLWQTRTECPFPGLTTHAYVWRGPNGNILFYSPASDADFEAIQELGGVSAQYLSHLDEAGPMLGDTSTKPDIVISSAFGGDSAFETVDNGRWQQCVAEALASVPT